MYAGICRDQGAGQGVRLLKRDFDESKILSNSSQGSVNRVQEKILYLEDLSIIGDYARTK